MAKITFMGAGSRRELIAGINHMGWLLEICDKDGNDLYPEIRRRAPAKGRTSTWQPCSTPSPRRP